MINNLKLINFITRNHNRYARSHQITHTSTHCQSRKNTQNEQRTTQSIPAINLKPHHISSPITQLKKYALTENQTNVLFQKTLN